MTHRSIIPAKSIPWEDCYVVRYESNNGIVLMHGFDHRQEVLFFISGEDVGIEHDDTPEDAIECATPILRCMLEIHNAATAMAYNKGYDQAKADVRKVLGV